MTPIYMVMTLPRSKRNGPGDGSGSWGLRCVSDTVAAASRKVHTCFPKSPSDTCFTGHSWINAGKFAGIWGHGESIKHGENRWLDSKQWYQKMDLPRITRVHWDGEIMISFWVALGSGAQSPFSVPLTIASPKGKKYTRYLRFLNSHGGKNIQQQATGQKKYPLKMLTSKSFRKKTDAQSFVSPRKSPPKSWAPLALRASLLASVGLSSVSVAGPSGGCGAGACGVPGSGATGLAGSVPSRGIWASCFATVFGGVFWGSWGLGASFESKCTSKFREFLGNTLPKERIRSLTVI